VVPEASRRRIRGTQHQSPCLRPAQVAPHSLTGPPAGFPEAASLDERTRLHWFRSRRRSRQTASSGGESGSVVAARPRGRRRAAEQGHGHWRILALRSRCVVWFHLHAQPARSPSSPSSRRSSLPRARRRNASFSDSRTDGECGSYCFLRPPTTRLTVRPAGRTVEPPSTSLMMATSSTGTDDGYWELN
jgi:hypothetical protein